MKLDLAAYLRLFPKICRAKFGRAYGFAALEKEFEYLRAGQKDRWLAARDVMKLFAPERTPFARYWPVPDEKSLEKALSQARLRLAPVAGHGEELVDRLLGVFHSIGVVSVVLRFAHPVHFGVFSAPVETLLQVHRPRAAELYIAYCQELAEWARHFEIPTVAETEMALWAFQQCLQRAFQDVDAEEARREIEGDLWVQRRRAALVVGPFLRRYGPLELARILVHEDAKLAGMIAGEEYERLLRLAAVKFYHREFEKEWALIEALARDGHISPEEKVDLREVWDTRNTAVHPGERPTPEAVDVMIDRIERICRRWE